MKTMKRMIWKLHKYTLILRPCVSVKDSQGVLILVCMGVLALCSVGKAADEERDGKSIIVLTDKEKVAVYRQQANTLAAQLVLHDAQVNADAQKALFDGVVRDIFQRHHLSAEEYTMCGSRRTEGPCIDAPDNDIVIRKNPTEKKK